MIDATAPVRQDPHDAASVSALADGAMEVTVGPATKERVAAYSQFAASNWIAPAQSAEWVGAWAANTASDCLIATIGAPNQPVLALALEAVRSGPARALRFMGGRHANGNFPVVDRTRIAELTPVRLASIFAEIGKARPDIDLVHLERLAPAIGSCSNPLLQLPHRRSPNIALAANLAGGFSAVLDRASGKRKRKKHRYQTRQFEAAGGWRRIDARTPDEIDRLLAAFFQMKEQRFRKMGIANAFGDPEVQRFFTDIFSSSLGPSPRFILHGLEVAGKLRAVTGSSFCGDRVTCEFGGIVEDELAHASPGDFLFFENVREAAEKGYAVYDFSVGDEPYKRLWCDTEIVQFDVTVPLTLKGHLHASGLRLAADAKRRAKSSRLLWSLIKRLRRPG